MPPRTAPTPQPPASLTPSPSRELRAVGGTFAWLGAAQGVSMAFAAAGSVLLARGLGDSGYGRLGFAFSFAGLFAVLLDLGLPTLMLTEGARGGERARRLVARSLSLKVLAAPVALALIPLLALATGKPGGMVGLVALAAAHLFFVSVQTLGASVLRVHGHARIEAGLKVLLHALLLSAAVGVLVLGFDLRTYLAAATGIAAATSALCLVFVHRRAAPLGWDVSDASRLARMALPLALSGAFVAVYYHLDAVLLSFLRGDAAVGLYRAAYQVVFGLLGLIALFHGAALPTVSRMLADETRRRDAVALLARVVRISVVVLVPIGIVVSLLAGPVVTLLFGAEYAGASGALAILVWSAVVSGFAIVYGNALLALGARPRYARLVGIGALVNVALNVALIPPFGLEGAAVATVATELVVLFLMRSALARSGVVIPLWGRTTRAA